MMSKRIERPSASKWLRRSLAVASMLVISASFAASTFAQTIDVGRGPVPLHVPASYSPTTAAPLIVLLHGYSGTGAVTESYMQFTPLANEFGFLFIAPDGLLDCASNQFWNATDACCHFCGGTIDDVGYLTDVVEEIKSLYNIDDRRVYLMGHSNGGFMSYRMACERADMIAGVATLAGATYFDPLDCTPSEPVHTLQIHGTADATILYPGGTITGGTVMNVSYPGAVQTVETWATYDGCSLTPDTSPAPLDLESSIAGNETTVQRYDDDCNPGGSAELWTIQGGGHIPSLATDFSREIVLHFFAHPKPDALFVPSFEPRGLLVLVMGIAAVGGAGLILRRHTREGG